MNADALLSRKPHAPPPMLTLWDEIGLPLSRVHEICGRARRSFALRIAAKTGAPVIWIAPAWDVNKLNAPGMAPWVDPGGFLFVSPRHLDDILWCMEESLRSGAVPLVVAELPEPPGMTPVRRLHLAAETGTTHGQHRPLGLILTPTGGAPGVETRWRMDPAHTPDSTGWRLERQRARMQPPKVWHLDEQGVSRGAPPA
ncbi:ImuA family protein [Tropicibacter naphthalenivorans]|uniref:SOS cell division inhibitor n=1 Tax=Tropicibacter naphthalenivorans TaxID=441103 RepID=A0A0P1G0F9_9RHOB|nr:hypothetical protein [Tropicibacter naphthalenivorans]CUH75188.1 hypothetical protein TRN7648_00312 [Tropicibacter naphthalenivorans]SMC45707.1 protein ImuA [Tropicibacter naphthalenivorans]